MAVENWDKAWNKYTEPNILGKILYKSRISALRKVLTIPKESTIIDVGCGCGDTLSIIRRLGYQNSIGIDAAGSSMKMSKQKHGFDVDVDVYFRDAMQTGYPDKHFDMVFSQGMLEHYQETLELGKILDEMCRITKKWILLLQPDQDSTFGLIKGWWERIGRSSWAREYYYSRHYYEYSLKIRGFNLIKSGSINFNEEMYLLFEKKQ